MLRDLLAELSEATSISSSSAGNRAQLLRYINRAAYEFYSTADLPSSLWEQSFEIHEQQQQISLPWYIDQVRAVRRADSRSRSKMESLAVRYHTDRWQQPYNTLRITARRALHTPLALESQLTATIAVAQVVPFSVTITGQTPSASSISETLTFLAGELTKTTVAQFAKDEPIGVEAISKDAITTCDVSVTDGSGTEVSLIPARLMRASHIVLMANDYSIGTYINTDSEIEVLYKRVFTPMFYDTDEFCFPALETAILWKARAYGHSMAKDEEARLQSMAAEAKANSVAADVLANAAAEVITIMTLDKMPGEYAFLSSGYKENFENSRVW